MIAVHPPILPSTPSTCYDGFSSTKRRPFHYIGTAATTWGNKQFVNPPSISWVPRLAVYLTFPAMVIVSFPRLFVRLRSRQIGNDDCWLALLTANSDDMLIATRCLHSCCCKRLSGTLIPESTLLGNTPMSVLSHTMLFY